MKKLMFVILAAMVLVGGLTHRSAAGPVELWVNNNDSNRYERHTLNPFNPTLFDSISMADQANGITMGGGVVYIADAVDNLQRHDPEAAPGSSLINTYSLPATAGEKGLAIGPDGNLYVQTLSGGTMSVQKLNPANGAVLDASFASYASGGAYDLIFGANGHLYTSNNPDNLVRHFNASGVFQDSVTVNNSRGLAFGPDGRLYVASRGDNVAYAFDVDGTGALINQVTYFSLSNVRDLDFNPVDGHAFAVDVSNVVEFDELGNEIGIVTTNVRTRTRIMITPEPASLALLGLGGLMMIRRRRA